MVHLTQGPGVKINIYPRAQLIFEAKKEKILIDLINCNYQSFNQGVTNSQINVLTERVLINIRFLQVCTKTCFVMFCKEIKVIK